MWKQRIITSLWWLLGLCIAGLLTAAIQYKKHLLCNGIQINIGHAKDPLFINETDIRQVLTANGAVAGKAVANIPLQQLEELLKKQPWISNAELFFDNNQMLNVSIEEREPLARIFTLQGTSFYIDSSGMQLPLSNDYSARVPMFTGLFSNKKKLSKPDSLLMNNVKRIAAIIQQDSFWNAQVSQVNITPYRTFEMIPVLGNQVIKLGNADSLQSKFNCLTAFYRQIWAKENFEKYETISAEFNGQIVAVKRGIPKPVIDTNYARSLIAAMRNGKDIVQDTANTSLIRVAPLQMQVNTSDSLSSKENKKPAVANGNILVNTSKQKKSVLTAGTKKRDIRKAVIKIKKH